MQTIESERQRIARHLHDDICSELVGYSLLASGVQQELQDANPTLAAQVKRIAEAVARVAERALDIARGMSPVLDGSALPYILHQLAADAAQEHGILCGFERGNLLVIPDTIANQLYYIAQEAIQNAARAMATSVTIELHQNEAGITLAVKDDCPEMPENAAAMRYIGLGMMKYHAGLIPGTLTIQKRKSGFEVTCCVPTKRSQIFETPNQSRIEPPVILGSTLKTKTPRFRRR